MQEHTQFSNVQAMSLDKYTHLWNPNNPSAPVPDVKPLFLEFYLWLTLTIHFLDFAI